MKKDIPLVNSILKVVASENLDISEDLKNQENKSIAEIMNEEKEKQKDKG